MLREERRLKMIDKFFEFYNVIKFNFPIERINCVKILEDLGVNERGEPILDMNN